MKLLSKRLALVWVLAIVFALSLSVYASSGAGLPDGCVYDGADIFNEDEKHGLNAEIEKYFGKTTCRVYILTFPKNEEYRYGYNVDRMVEETLKKYSSFDSNMIVLAIRDNEYRNYDMYVYGKAERRITYTEIDAILDAPNVFSSIKNGDDYNGALEFIYLAHKSYSPNWSAIIIIAAVCGLVVSATVAICVICFYKKKLRATIYPLDRYARLDLKCSDERFMGSFVTKRIIRSSSGGHGGGYHGGGHGGGGGHHRGGR